MMQSQLLWKALLLSLVFCLVQIVAALPANAVPIPAAEFRYSASYDQAFSTASGKNWWAYDLTVFNTTDQANIGQNVADSVLYYFEIPVVAGGSFIGRGLPTGWSSFSAPSWDGSTVYSFSPDVTADFGAEIIPGASLGGFQFLLDYQASTLLFNALIWNPDGAPLTVLAAGTQTPSPVPEPSTVLLLLAGAVGVFLWRGRIRQQG